MKKKNSRKDTGSIFNPVMYLALVILSAQLMFLFTEYRRATWLSDSVSNTMTDALLGAAVLNETELLQYGRTGDLAIYDPEEKYQIFQKILITELGLDTNLKVTENSLPLMTGELQIKDFRIYSVAGDDITLYLFDSEVSYSTAVMHDMLGSYYVENGLLLEETTLMAEVEFIVNFLGKEIPVRKYHMVDIAQNAWR